MIKRVYFLKAKQDNGAGGICHSFRIVQHTSWFSKPMGEIVDAFFKEISEANGLSYDGWCLESFSRIV